MLTKLEESGLGCFVAFNCYNTFMYADDIILLSISVTDLQLMFSLCANVLAGLDLPINVTKCHCLRIGPRFNTACSTITVQGVSIQW